MGTPPSKTRSQKLTNFFDNRSKHISKNQKHLNNEEVVSFRRLKFIHLPDSQILNMKVMSDIFLKEDISNLLHNKFVVFIGDSIVRAIYKDIVLLLQKNQYLRDGHLRAKGEMSFEKDELIEGGRKGIMNNGIQYREVRQFKSDWHLVRFYFATRCYNTYIESVLADLQEEPHPDLVVMNSCLWDISRYGKNGVEEYKKNLVKLFDRFQQTLPEECLLIWTSTLPISKNARGGFLVPEVEFMNSSLRLDILEANFYAREIVVKHGYDMVDLHFYLRNQLHRRAHDGIHWDMTAHRRITNLLLTHISEAWNEKLPGRSLRRQSLIARDENENFVSQVEEDFERNADNNADTNNNDLAVHLQNPFIKLVDSNSEDTEKYGGPVRRIEYQHQNIDEENYQNFSDERRNFSDQGRFIPSVSEQIRRQQHQWQISHNAQNQLLCQQQQTLTRQSWVFNNDTVTMNNTNTNTCPSRQERLFQLLVANARSMCNRDLEPIGPFGDSEVDFDYQQQNMQQNHFSERFLHGNQIQMADQGYEENRPMMVNFNAPVSFTMEHAMQGADHFNWQPYQQHESDFRQRNAARYFQANNPYHRNANSQNPSYYGPLYF